MMGIYIKGMEMPTSCVDCPLAMQDYTTLFGKNFSRTKNSYACVLTHKTITSTKRNRFCPLVPVPPHGRLIDADALYKDLLDDVGYGEAERFNDYWLGEQPTIVPEEEGE